MFVSDFAMLQYQQQIRIGQLPLLQKMPGQVFRDPSAPPRIFVHSAPHGLWVGAPTAAVIRCSSASLRLKQRAFLAYVVPIK